MKLLENGIIPVYESKTGQAVNARDLHEFLEVGRDFTTWIKDRIEKYGFTENEDFVIFPESGENPGRPKMKYILSLDTAKEIAMVENNERGSEARKYFISIEKKFKQLVKPKCIEDVLIESLQEMKNIRLALTETGSASHPRHDNCLPGRLAQILRRCITENRLHNRYELRRGQPDKLRSF